MSKYQYSETEKQINSVLKHQDEALKSIHFSSTAEADVTAAGNDNMNHQFLTNYTETTFLKKSRIICSGADPFVFRSALSRRLACFCCLKISNLRWNGDDRGRIG